MKIISNMVPAVYVIASYVMPALAFAHGGVDDGDEEVMVPPTTDERMKVAIILGVILLIAIIGWIYIKKRNATPPKV